MELKFLISTTGGPRSLQERENESWLQAVLCEQWLFTKGCMGCKGFFFEEGINVMFFKKNRLTLLSRCIFCCLPVSQVILKCFRRGSGILVFQW